MGSNHTLRPSEGGTVTRAAPCRAPSEDVSGVQQHMSKARRAFVHGPPGGTLADLRLRPAGRLNRVVLTRSPSRPDMTAICALRTAGVDVNRTFVAEAGILLPDMRSSLGHRFFWSARTFPQTRAVDQGWRPLVSARAGSAPGKTEEPEPKHQGARLSCDRSCQGQLELSPRYSSTR